MPTSNNFRDHLFELDSPRLASFRGLNAKAYGKAVYSIPLVAELIEHWTRLGQEPFRGMTCDGSIKGDIFHLADEGAPVKAMADAANTLLGMLGENERGMLLHDIDAPEWRKWSNPEFLMHPNGLRLEELAPGLQNAVMDVVRASLGEHGYHKACGCMRANKFLGQLCDLPRIMNEWSYNFLLFGQPSMVKPWGWNLYGHHLALNCFVLGRQMVISPTFMGAEPDTIDQGPDAGVRLFNDEEMGGLELMRSLSPSLRKKATTYKLMHDPKMPVGRWNPADQRHLGGAFQDNRIVPYEGVPATEFNATQRRALMTLVEAFVSYLPPAPLSARLMQIESKLDETWWSWIGGHGDEDPFYYRIQSPLVMIEFDHHSGVWLSNEEPAKCHIHTVVRTPNGNDYGKDLLRQHYLEVHPGKSIGQR